ncbi:MAG TPA: DUF3696 domain-containing protein [Petrimonas sp.]|uniref:DUF3696 domain-containing protein n=1 Tax=Petrimonas sp. TaxID=2023866 RepID=UPI001766266C|nr:DUF3696 domain-containing protein [Petrimonas sp.]HHV85187.1 DUF3696 domain-containing protein [Petrimonas sp.]
MITKLTLERFKCFKKPEEFSFSKINILTGMNGRGKSTALQSLLLLSQSIRKNNSPYTLLINGEWVELGSFNDLLNSDSKIRNFSFNVELDIDVKEYTLSFEYAENKENDRIADLTGLKINLNDYFEELSSGPGGDLLAENEENYGSNDENVPKSFLTTEAVKPINIFKNFQYISADRSVPKEFVKKWDDSTESLKIGTRGENVINVLAYHGKKLSIEPERCNKAEKDETLLKQTIAWLSFVMEGANIKVEEIESSSFLSLLLGAGNDNIHLYKPSNIGFGYGYVLPLIVTGLAAKKGDTIIVENPEAHLHPGAQSRLTQFLATVASSGIQLFIETHSEHVVNAIRLIALKQDINLSNKDVSIYFFTNNFHAEKLEMNINSQISNWPEGFFDQQEKDLSQILKLGLLK